MARPKKNKDENIVEPVINQPETKATVSGMVKITSLKTNFKFGIYWLDCGKVKEFKVEEFEKMKSISKEFDEEVKKGNLKIEY